MVSLKIQQYFVVNKSGNKAPPRRVYFLLGKPLFHSIWFPYCFISSTHGSVIGEERPICGLEAFITECCTWVEFPATYFQVQDSNLGAPEFGVAA